MDVLCKIHFVNSINYSDLLNFERKIKNLSDYYLNFETATADIYKVEIVEKTHEVICTNMDKIC